MLRTSAIAVLAVLAFLWGNGRHRSAKPPTATQSTTTTRDSTPRIGAPTTAAILAARGADATTLLARFLPNATAEHLQHLVESAATVSDQTRQPDACWHLLGNRWFQLDPQAAARITTNALAYGAALIDLLRPAP